MKHILYFALAILLVGLYGCSAVISNSYPADRSLILVELAVDDGLPRLKYLATSIDLDVLQNHWSWNCSTKVRSVIYRISIGYWQTVEEYHYSITQWDETAKQYLSVSNGFFPKLLNRPSAVVASIKVQSPYYSFGLIYYHNALPWPSPYGSKMLDCAVKPKL